MDKHELVRLAFEARQSSYAPYSGFRVGAAVLAGSGRAYRGCNVENASYGASICAERAAVLRAVCEGERTLEAVAVVGFAADTRAVYSFPCGICRQFLREFAAPGMKIYVARTPDDIHESVLEEMLPHSFGPESLL